jgi:hypothetical protein
MNRQGKDKIDGQIAGSKKINELIYLCFDYLCEDDKRKFVKKFREQPSDSRQIMHTFRELIFGAYLRYCGFHARYDYAIDGNTPDWCILQESLNVSNIIELVNFHIDQETDTDIDKSLHRNGLAFYWRDGRKDNIQRLYASIQQKILAYRNLVDKLQIPYYVAIYCDSRTSVDVEEIKFCLLNNEDGLFRSYHHLSGLSYFVEGGGRYYFRFIPNPYTLREFRLPDGGFPPIESKILED